MAGKTKSRRGGFLGSLINQAVVPFGILGLQQSYKKKDLVIGMILTVIVTLLLVKIIQ